MQLFYPRYAALFTVLVLFAAIDIPVTGQSIKPDMGPHIYLQEPQVVPAHYEGRQSAAAVLISGQAQAVTMASGDFDEDGVEDLAVGYSTSTGGMIAIYRGNLDAFAPQSTASWNAIAANRFPPPYAGTMSTFPTQSPAQFLASGDFTGRGHRDLVVAARDSKVLYVFAGDGEGHFAAQQQIALPGMKMVNALASGPFGTDNRFGSLLVGVSGDTSGAGSAVLWYTGSEAGLSLMASIPLPAPASAFAFGDFNGDSNSDAAVLARGQIFLLYGAPQTAALQMKRVSLPFKASALALGSFVHDRDPHLQMAILSPEGTVHIVAHGGFDSRGWTLDELEAIRRARLRHDSSPFGHVVYGAGDEGWHEVENFPAAAPFDVAGQFPILMRARISGHSSDDLVIINARAREMRMISHANLAAGADVFTPGQQSIRAYSAGTPVAALSAHVNAEARLGLVVLHQGQALPSTMAPLPDPTFTVNTTNDTVDANPGDGICADSHGLCSLRAAIMEANAVPGADTIMVPAGTYTLTIPGIDGTQAIKGHLDIRDGLTIVGADPNTTIIQAGTGLNSQGIPNGIDKVFSINPNASLPGFDTNLSNLTIRYGLNVSTQNPFGGAFDWDAGTDGTGTLRITNCNITNNATVITDSSSTTAADGGGISLTNEFPGSSAGSVSISNSNIVGNIAHDVGGGIFFGGLPLTMSKTQILNNQAVDNRSLQGTGQIRGQQAGGGIFVGIPRVGQTIIQNSTVSGNQAGGEGGGIFTNVGLLITQVTISQNQALQSGGGLFSNLINDTTTVTSANITANTVTASGGSGGGIEVDASPNGNRFNISFSRIMGNIATSGNGLNNIGGIVTANDNWWGCDPGPSVAPCDLVNGVGAGSFTPWLKFQSSATPSSIIVSNSTTITAGFLQDSAGATFPPDPNKFSAFAGLPVIFQNVVNGTATPTQTIIGPGGTATTMFTGAAVGTGSVDAVVDKATATAIINITDCPGSYSFSASPISQTIVASATATYNLTVAAQNGFAGTVLFSNVIGLPTGATASFNPPSVTGSGNSTLTIATANSLAAGNYSPTVVSACGNQGVATGINLNVQNFALSVNPSAPTVTPGNSVNYPVTITPQNGFTGAVSFSVSGLPSGATASFNPTLVNTSGTSTLTVSTSTSTPGGFYVLTITATSGGLSHIASTGLQVTGFSLAVTPSSRTILQGTSANYQISVTPFGGFTGPITLNVSGLPSGASFSPASINGSGVSTLTIATASPTLQKSYQLAITGSSGVMNSAVSTVLLLTSAAPPVITSLSPAKVVVGGPAFSLTVNGANFPSNAIVQVNGASRPTSFVSSNHLVATIPGADIAASGFPNITVFVPSNGVFSDATSLVAFRYGDLNFDNVINILDLVLLGSFLGNHIQLLDTAPADVYQDGMIDVVDQTTLANYLVGNVHALPVTPVGDFSISATPALQTITAGNNASYTVSIADMNGFIGNVTLSVSGLPSDASASFSPGAIAGAGTSTLTGSSSASTGTFSLTITGTSGSRIHSSQVTLTINAPAPPPPPPDPPPDPCSTSVLKGTDVSCPIPLD